MIALAFLLTLPTHVRAGSVREGTKRCFFVIKQEDLPPTSFGYLKFKCEMTAEEMVEREVLRVFFHCPRGV